MTDDPVRRRQINMFTDAVPYNMYWVFEGSLFQLGKILNIILYTFIQYIRIIGQPEHIRICVMIENIWKRIEGNKWPYG